MIDLDGEGLLTGTHGPLRVARRRLLSELLDHGFTLPELREAVAKDRVAVLLTERAMRPEDQQAARYTPAEVAELAGVELRDLAYVDQALGVPLGEPERRIHTDADVELGRQLGAALGAGMSVEAVAELDRVIARAVKSVVAAGRAAVLEATLAPGMTELEAARAWAAAASELVPVARERIALAFDAHLRSAIEEVVIGPDEIHAGRTAGVSTVTVAFADLVGFTHLGESLSAEELGKVARRLEAIAASVVRPPTTIAKMIGDAAMLIGPDPTDLLDATVALIERAGEEADFPSLRVGIAHGEAHERAGEWYGATVNLASRITEVGPPGAVVATDALRHAASGDFCWIPFIAPKLKGVSRAPRLFTVVRPACLQVRNIGRVAAQSNGGFPR